MSSYYMFLLSSRADREKELRRSKRTPEVLIEAIGRSTVSKSRKEVKAQYDSASKAPLAIEQIRGKLFKHLRLAVLSRFNVRRSHPCV